MSRAQTTPARRPRLREKLTTHLRVGQSLAFTIGALLTLAVLGIGLALVANARLSDRRKLLVDRIAPAQLAASNLENGLVNEETGVRGFVITRQASFLAPYQLGLAAEARAYTELRSLLQGSAASYQADAAAVRARAQDWQRVYVAPVLAGRPSSTALAAEGKARFDAIRAALSSLQGALASRRSQARAELFSAARTLTITLIVVGVLIAAGMIGAALLQRLIVTRPLARLGLEVRRVTRGGFDEALPVLAGAREIVEVRGDVEAMREIIVGELAAATAARAQLEEQALELERSNAELEQFAYVASHDLQEPLRKVASFCQALQERYQGQLDERADQYIYFAVDGAKRMQILINDLLAFSRVGRAGHAHEQLDAGEIVAEARASLSEALEESGGTVRVSELPAVQGDRALLVSVFQNLIANGLKFRGPDPPVIEIEARREGTEWQFTCTDNGIGIEPAYAERVFVIFQRLHPKEAYPGTGIGLAMSRKIIEHHGGRIWVDTDHPGGARIRFTLPVLKETQP